MLLVCSSNMKSQRGVQRRRLPLNEDHCLLLRVPQGNAFPGFIPASKNRSSWGARRVSSGSERLSAPGRLRSAAHALALFNGRGLKQTLASGCNPPHDWLFRLV